MVGLNRRRFLRRATALTAGLAAGMAGGLSGCARDRGTDQVQLWWAFSRPEQAGYAERHLVRAYHEHDSTPVALSVKDSNTVDRLVQTAVASGRGPDLFPTPGPAQVLMYLDAGKLRPLDDYAERFGWDQRLRRWAIDASTQDGRLYSVPMEYESMVLLYNPEVFRQHGWDPPRNRAEFERICRDAAAAGLMPVAAGNADYRPATEWLVTAFLNHYCGPDALYEALSGSRRWTDPVFTEGIGLLAEYCDRGWIGGGVESFFTNRNDTLYTMLAGGEAAMMIVGSWGFSDAAGFFGPAAGNQQRWAWSHVPSFSEHAPERFFEIAIGSSVVLNADSAVPDRAAAYLDWRLSDPARILTALADAELIPPPVELPATAYPSNLDERVRHFYEDLDARSPRGYTTWTHWPPKANNHMYRGMDRVLVGKDTPAEFCARLQQLFDTERAAGRAPKVPEPRA